MPLNLLSHNPFTMKTLNSHIKLLFFSTLLTISSSYTTPTQYFINCGSSSTTTLTTRTFVGDTTFSTGKSSTVTATANDPSTPSVSLYQTARIYTQPSTFQLSITQNGTYIIRLHFYPFSSPKNLSTALFNVSVSGFSLLQDFTTQNTTTFPLIKEYLIYIQPGTKNLRLDFIPSQSSFAFINAIEAFITPDSFISDESSLINTTGSNTSYSGLLDQVLHTIHRINFGDLFLSPENDTLWRTWITDDAYLLTPKAAKNSDFYTADPSYSDLINENVYIAPALVYKTAKELNVSSSNSSLLNATWSFNVSTNGQHFVRVHFCDIVSSSLDVINFNLYINKFRYFVSPYDIIPVLGAPFYLDYVLDSDASGFINISIGSITESINHTAFLNGLEIMELMENSGVVLPESKSNSKLVFAIVGSICGCLAVFILAGGFWYVKFRKAKAAQTSDFQMMPGGASTHSKDKISSAPNPVPYLDLALKRTFIEIKEATNGFEKMIGEGGFGKVYVGTLRVGIKTDSDNSGAKSDSGIEMDRSRKVAVKRSSPENGQGILEFQTEITVLSKIRHRHLVSLIGYCDEGSEMILIYEFMEKGTLKEHLYGSDKPTLSWKQRLEICIGAAKGLEYLHTGLERAIIHRDVKPTNILLDENWVAKVADFGLAKSSIPDTANFSVDVKGSFGYLDPECLKTLQWTEKSDVYSFGVVLLEVLCARPAVNTSLHNEEVNLAEWVSSCQRKGTIEEIIDPFLVGKIKPRSLRKFLETSDKCLNSKGAERPSMSDVLWDLQYALDLQDPPQPREVLDDSTADASMPFPLPVGRLPSMSLTPEEYDTSVVGFDYSTTDADQVFSQLNVGKER